MPETSACVLVRTGHHPVGIALAAGAAAMCVPPMISLAMVPVALHGTFPLPVITAWFVVMFLGAATYLSGVAPQPVAMLDAATTRVVIGRLMRERIGCFAVGWMLVSLAAGVASTGAHGVPIALFLACLACGPGWRIRQTFVDAGALRRWRAGEDGP